MYKRILIIVLFLKGITILAQNNISLKLSTISYQFTETQPELLNLQLSENGKLAFEPGLIFSYEGYASSNTAFKFLQSAIYDKAAHFSATTQVMIKFKIAKSFKHSLYLGFGPAVHYRKSWSDMDGYVNEEVYTEKSDWQYKINWLSGELEYNFYLGKFSDLCISINHTQAESIGLAIGYKYWINKKPVKKKGCVSCPSLH
ncbi:MAG: hypothetical protein U0W24_01195 [Bacteroidales bacterium]